MCRALGLSAPRLGVAALCLATLLPGASPATAKSLLNRSINERVAEAKRLAPALGVHVVEVDSGEEIYSYQPDTRRILASNTKLFTTAAALDLLPSEFRFETPFQIRGAITGEVLDGDLGVVGSGDPNISGRHHDGDYFAIFRAWARALAAWGVRRVEGDLYLAKGLYEPLSVHPDWPRDQLWKWYEAPVAALSFNDNCVLVRVKPGAGPGQPAEVTVEPDVGLFEVRNQVTTTSSSRRHRVRIGRAPGQRVVTVSGAVYHRRALVESWVSVPDPVEYFGLALRHVLSQEGISVAGRSVQVGTLPQGDWRTVAAHRTDLMTTVQVVNKRSQNFYAESLLKRMAAQRHGQGTWSTGVAEVESFLQRLGLEAAGLRLADGSGMSRGNLATPRHLTQLLRRMFRHPKAQDFMRSLPYSGEPKSSWSRRLAQPPYLGNVYAKTGSLRGVVTLSGYAKGRSGQLYAFSILLNETQGSGKAKKAQDRILQALIDHG